jgi:hypothetical protein
MHALAEHPHLPGTGGSTAEELPGMRGVVSTDVAMRGIASTMLENAGACEWAGRPSLGVPADVDG